MQTRESETEENFLVDTEDLSPDDTDFAIFDNKECDKETSNSNVHAEIPRHSHKGRR
jgi:hypothetical protein